MDKEINPNPQNLPGTNFLSSNYTLDTDVRAFTSIQPRKPLPSKQRTLRLHIPQVVEPIMMVDVHKITVGRQHGENRLDLSRQYGNLLGVSRNHAMLIYDDGRYSVRDLGSTNGTFLNGERLDPNMWYPVNQNDQLRFGHFVTIIEYT